MDGLLDQLTALPSVVLYAIMTIAGAVENVFPPVPADTIVALGSWLAARGRGSVLWAFLGTWIGNVAGAVAMYGVGRSHGVTWMHRHFPALANGSGEARLRAFYARYGVLALVLSRFIPGVRALVPPVAGAMHVPAIAAIGAIAVASAIWYGVISYVAFNAGAEWEELQRLVARSGTWAAVGAAGLLLLLVLAWMLRRRRRRTPA